MLIYSSRARQRTENHTILQFHSQNNDFIRIHTSTLRNPYDNMKLIQILSLAALSAALATPPHNSTLNSRDDSGDSDLTITLYTNGDCTSKKTKVYSALWYGGSYTWTEYNGFSHYGLSRTLRSGESIDFYTVGPGKTLGTGSKPLGHEDDPCVNPAGQRVMPGTTGGCHAVGAIAGCFEVCNGCV